MRVHVIEYNYFYLAKQYKQLSLFVRGLFVMRKTGFEQQFRIEWFCVIAKWFFLFLHLLRVHQFIMVNAEVQPKCLLSSLSFNKMTITKDKHLVFKRKTEEKCELNTKKKKNEQKFGMFKAMLKNVTAKVISLLFRMDI